MDETLRLFYDLPVKLHNEDRFFPHRRALESGPLPVLRTAAAPRVRVSAAAVPYRPNRGIYALVNNQTTDSGDRPRTTSSKSADDLLEIAGVAGVWSFGRRDGDGAQGETGPPPGAGALFEADVTICFLDDDPVRVAKDVTDLIGSSFDDEGSSLRFAGPFETVVPWSWDWFDK